MLTYRISQSPMSGRWSHLFPVWFQDLINLAASNKTAVFSTSCLILSERELQSHSTSDSGQLLRKWFDVEELNEAFVFVVRITDDKWRMWMEVERKYQVWCSSST